MEFKQTMMGNRRVENQTVSGLRALISESTQPVFLIDIESDLIFEANRSAISGCEPFNPLGEMWSNIIHMESDSGPAFFDGRWFEPSEELISWNNKTYTKLTLNHPASMPDASTLFTMRNMIAVLLHRLRSPMTGMQGYLEMIGNVPDETDRRKLNKVEEGLDYLFEIMDELELLHHADAYLNEETNGEQSDARSIIREILYTYEPAARNRITVKDESDGGFRFNATELKQILTLLINNATEHISGNDDPITIEIESDRKITVTNGGIPIPDDIASSLYFPFVTTKANNLGIGLSLAQIIAARRHATILLESNSEDDGIRFSLYCSPVSE